MTDLDLRDPPADSWLLASKFDDACGYFDDVRDAAFFRVRLDGKLYMMTREAFTTLAHGPDAERAVYLPAAQ
ncbi:hypothetical protein SAMN02787142_1259 [Burkholderia sp. WP9]|uniref:hypothetical protein n=1 Tax=Burkholderia sp. WP9 TaxID=1500263 RepID=UPI00089C71DA|nr:hypothetical protein [Burkholderia sp. WP9]SEC36298.1 hypothetical protein SAMN02787142_1259 [Burkholderia sp. WP9]